MRRRQRVTNQQRGGGGKSWIDTMRTGRAHRMRTSLSMRNGRDQSPSGRVFFITGLIARSFSDRERRGTDRVCSIARFLEYRRETEILSDYGRIEYIWPIKGVDGRITGARKGDGDDDSGGEGRRAEREERRNGIRECHRRGCRRDDSSSTNSVSSKNSISPRQLPRGK